MNKIGILIKLVLTKDFFSHHPRVLIFRNNALVIPTFEFEKIDSPLKDSVVNFVKENSGYIIKNADVKVMDIPADPEYFNEGEKVLLVVVRVNLGKGNPKEVLSAGNYWQSLGHIDERQFKADDAVILRGLIYENDVWVMGD